MAKVSLSEHMKEQPGEANQEETRTGPFIAISRQFGCYGFSLGLLLMEILNEDADSASTWKIYHREILERLASETKLGTELLDRQRRAKPKLIAEFFRSFSKERLPSGYEVRKRITGIIRNLATEGHAIIIGQGSSASTEDLTNRLSIRLTAPSDWRAKEVAFREGLSETKSKLRLQEKQREKQYLRKLYATRFHSKPSFDLIYDCSTFTLTQIAQHVVYAMKLKGLV